MGQTAGTEKKPRAKAERNSTVLDRFICPFDMRALAKRHHLQLTEVGRAIGVESANFHNWFKQIPGHMPLSVAKACMLIYEPDKIPEFEEGIRGKIERRQRTLFVSEQTALLARRYDNRRPGERLIMKGGEILILQRHPPEPGEDAEPETTAPEPEQARLSLVPDSEPEPMPEPAAEVVAATYIPPAFALPSTYTVQTPRGLITVEMPGQDATPGERELLTAMVLRLNVQNSELHRRNFELDVQNRDLHAQASGLRGRIKELVDANRELVDLSRTTAAKGIVTVHSATTPKVATPKDAASVKAAVREIPELERLVDQLMKETTTVEAGVASSGFTPGAASATALH